MKPILVTGAAGFIGYHLSNRLMDEGYKVVGIDNMNDYYDINLKESRLNNLCQRDDFIFVKGDICDDGLLERIFTDYDPEVVINLAAQAGVRYSIDHPESYIHSNLVGFYNILEMCRRHKVEHLIFASSSSVYGNQKKTPFSEDDKADEPVSLYAATKKSNEEMGYSYSCLYGIPMTGLRFFTVYGPYGRPDMAYFKFADRIRKGKPIEIYNNGDMYRDFTYVDDVVNVIVKMLYSKPEKDGNDVRFTIYNIGKGNPDKLIDFINVLEKLYGKEAEKIMKPMQPGDVYQTYADVSKLVKDFSYAPKVSIDEGLDKFMKWYKEFYNVQG